MKYLVIFGAEFVFNLLMVVPAVAVVRWWTNKKAAIAWAVGGAVVVSLAMRLIEPSIRENYQEPITVTLTNIVTYSLAFVLVALYLAAESKWSNWRIDLAFGGVLGLGLAAAQILSLPELSPLGAIVHGLTLTAAAALGLVGIRLTKKQGTGRAFLSAVVISLLIALTMLFDHVYSV